MLKFEGIDLGFVQHDRVTSDKRLMPSLTDIAALAINAPASASAVAGMRLNGSHLQG
jgi:hypothetical protein